MRTHSHVASVLIVHSAACNATPSTIAVLQKPLYSSKMSFTYLIASANCTSMRTSLHACLSSNHELSLTRQRCTSLQLLIYWCSLNKLSLCDPTRLGQAPLLSQYLLSLICHLFTLVFAKLPHSKITSKLVQNISSTQTKVPQSPLKVLVTSVAETQG